mgnify:CR=1 FL=1
MGGFSVGSRPLYLRVNKMNYFSIIFCSFVKQENSTMKDINRLKVVLAEKKRTNKWLAEQLGKDPATVSKWCTNTCQPDLGNLMRIAQLLEVDVNELLRFNN